jgi:hypothetical protein
MTYFLANLTAPEGFWSNFLTAWWWVNAIMCVVLAVIFLISLGEYLADPAAYRGEKRRNA